VRSPIRAPRSLGTGQRTALLIGTGRIAIGVAFAISPVTSVRLLGVDTATANRIAWLARMTAARDTAIGVGTVLSTRQAAGSGGWLLAGAACDIADASFLALALQRRQVSRIPAGGVVVGALGLGAVAIASVLNRRS
jgi:hypothetical protein